MNIIFNPYANCHQRASTAEQNIENEEKETQECNYKISLINTILNIYDIQRPRNRPFDHLQSHHHSAIIARIYGECTRELEAKDEDFNSFPCRYFEIKKLLKCLLQIVTIFHKTFPPTFS